MTLITEAARALVAGNLAAFPTETVYGLGADAENETAVARIYSVKGRPQDHPLIVHIPSREFVSYWTSSVPEYAIALAKAFWPGPMTLILQRSDAAKNFITGGQDSVGLRVPGHEVAISLLEEFASLGGKGVAAPSANRFGKVSPTTAEAVREELAEHLSDFDLILDGGASQVGIESTIIDCTGDTPKILRPGAITPAQIDKATGIQVAADKSSIRVSGALENHYAPEAKVVLDEDPIAGDGFIALATATTPAGVIRLASPSSIEQFASELYQALRNADNKNLKRVVIWQPVGDGLAIAIRDRLEKARTKL